MKITATYKTSTQVGPDDWNVFTEVVHLEGKHTLEAAYGIIERRMGASRGMPVNVELHFAV